MADPKKPGKQEDPIERLGRMIDERIKSAFDGRDQKAREEKDPWARLEGIVDRAVAKRLDALAANLEEEGGEEEGGRKPPKVDDDKILGGIFG